MRPCVHDTYMVANNSSRFPLLLVCCPRTYGPLIPGTFSLMVILKFPNTMALPDPLVIFIAQSSWL